MHVKRCSGEYGKAQESAGKLEQGVGSGRLGKAWESSGRRRARVGLGKCRKARKRLEEIMGVPAQIQGRS